MPSPSTTAAPELYGRYLSATSDAEARAVLDDLFAHWLIGWCKDSVDRNLSGYGLRDVDRADLAADITAEVLLAVTARLSASRTGLAEPVGNIRAYLSSAARNACFARIRARCPQHVQLQNRIRYLTRSDLRFAAFESAEGEPLIALSKCTDRLAPVACPELQRTVERLDVILEQLLTLAAGPIRVPDALRSVAAALGISDSAGNTVDPESVAAAGHPTDYLLAERQTLAVLWGEVRELPLSQRTALLLNLRDADGHGVIELLPATGLATFSELAAVLSMTMQELAGVWNELPLEDIKIAALLGLTRQQVINLRKAARDRLARRTRKPAGDSVGNKESHSPSTTSVGIFGRARRAVETAFGASEQR